MTNHALVLLDHLRRNGTDLLQLLVEVLRRVLGDEVVDLLLPAGVLLVPALGQAEARNARAQPGGDVLGQPVDVVRGSGRRGGGGRGGAVVAL